MRRLRETHILPFNVFVSSKDRLADDRTAAEAAIADLDLVPVRVQTSTWLATSSPDEYLQQVRQSNIVVLILAPVSTDDERADYYKYVRAEVDLAFAEGKTVLLFTRNTAHSPSKDAFLSEVQYKVFAREFHTSIELYDLVKTSLLNELIRRYKRQPELFKSRPQFYEFVANLARNTQQRLVVSQLTPTLLLGPRRGLPYERSLHDALVEVATRSSTSVGPEVLILFNTAYTQRELKERSSEYDRDTFFRRCDTIRSLTSPRFFVVAAPADTTHYLVIDHQYAVGHAVGRQPLGIVDTSKSVSQELYESARANATEAPEQGIAVFEDLVRQSSPEKVT